MNKQTYFGLDQAAISQMLGALEYPSQKAFALYKEDNSIDKDLIG